MSRHLLMLAGLLTGVGIGVFLYKAIVLEVPVTPDQSREHWNVEARVSFIAQGGPVKATLFLPRGASELPVIDEGFTSRGFGLTSERIGGQRAAVWAIREAKGPRNLYYRATLFAGLGGRKGKRAARGAGEEETEIQQPGLNGPRLTAAETVLARARERSADVGTLAALLLRELSRKTADEESVLLLGPRPTREHIIQVVVTLLAMANVPARAMHGIRLEQQRHSVPVRTILEAWNGREWLAFDPGEPEMTVPEDFLPWWGGTDPIVSLQGGRKLEVNLSVTRAAEVGVAQVTPEGGGGGSLLLRFSTLSLPVATQVVYRVVLMLPLGALLVVLIRNVIGFTTFGTFMPVLIALAFRETQLLRGLTLFVIVVLAGLAVRFYLERLKLLLVPRLAAVMTVVVLLMAALSILSNQLGLEAGLSVALFPMVILTMTIERMMVVWDERGPGEAFTQGTGSLAAAVAAYLVMNVDLLGHLVFVFPELLLVVMAVMLLLGRYTGYRLTELPRFKVLARKSN